MSRQTIDPTKIVGWGIDADKENDPTFPMRNIEGDSDRGMNWKRPRQQEETVEILQSIERDSRPAVFGTSTPPRGFSGMLRRVAFKYSESDWTHWLLLMAADRLNVVEGLLQDLVRLRVPNIPAEMGIKSELIHNREVFLKKMTVSAALFGSVVILTRMRATRRRRNAQPRR